MATTFDDDLAQGRETQRLQMLDLTRRMVAHATGKTTDFADQPMPVPVGTYSDPARAEAEVREMFLKLPLVAGLSCDVPEPGSKMLFEVAGRSILIMRGKDGQLRGFLNACRHRGVRLVENCTTASRLSCPFHGWTYDLEGRLVGQPGKAAFEGLEQGALSLTRVPVAEWCGLVLVRADPAGEPIDAEAWFGDLAPLLRSLHLGNLAPVKKHREPVAANWKFAQDTFFEGYHFSSLHPQTISVSSLTDSLVHDSWGPHQRVMMSYRFFEEWGRMPEAEWGEVPYQGIHLLFPNTILYVGNLEALVKDRANHTDRQIFGFWRGFPDGGPDRSYTLLETYRPASQSEPATVKEYEDVTDFIVKVIASEDYALCEQGQKNLMTLPRETNLYFGRNECALQSIHRNINALIEHSDS
jgi:phenylpropionate dioxygenase-like ring-hydroxylating dioxygenase large terminal subunit